MTAKTKADKKASSLANKLSKVSAQAKSLGINTAKADSMVSQTRREGSKSYKGSKEEKAFLASNIGTESPTISPPPVTKNEGDMLGYNTAGSIPEGFVIQDGMVTKDEKASDQMNAAKEANANVGNIASSILGYIKPEENQLQNAYEDTYGITSRQAGREYRRAQEEVQQYTSQLNNITSSRDASILALEDTGRGQTTGFIGGEQGRIQRQAAIAALPVQAQLAAAQGNLEIAKSHVDSLFQMKIKDIETEQAYKNTVANTWMSVANQQQSNLLNAAIADSNARAEAKKIAMNDAKQIAMQAIEYGQSSLAASVMKLDPTSATYQQDVMNAMGRLSKPVAVGKRDTQMVNGQLIDMQTGEIISTLDTSAGGTISGKPQTQAQAKVMGYADRLKEAEKILQNSNKFASLLSVGGILPNALKTEARQEYEQAKRNFVNAVLRTESGAVISDQEFANAEKQYFPSYGDSEGVLSQKAANRNTVINNFYREANVARPVSAGDIIEANGTRYKVDLDGVTLIEL